MSKQVFFIVGASKGFGFALAQEALQRGHHVIAAARSVSRMEPLRQAGATVLPLDLTADEPTLAEIVRKAYAIHNRFDQVMAVSGYALVGSVEESSPQEFQDQFDVNVLGLHKIVRQVLPYLREQKSGVITTFGSVASYTSYAATTLYAVTKWAVSAFSIGLASEVAPFGIKVCCVEPGFFRTDFLEGSSKSDVATQIPAYEQTPVGEYRRFLASHNQKQIGDVVKGAAVILDVITQSGVAKGREIPTRLPLGSDTYPAITRITNEIRANLDDWRDIATKTDHVDA